MRHKIQEQRARVAWVPCRGGDGLSSGGSGEQSEVEDQPITHHHTTTTTTTTKGEHKRKEGERQKWKE
ncbi:hypothetical protein E2C01_018282 [Portunus trituberculatus]|uniref:Uncharacterized protein n=1 Tax=Portunus trituberculatus TaxID=210409 RepID=A0A5B7DVP6_PORTR|nr:hypothetical protein [Portunus trituberculatus]